MSPRGAPILVRTARAAARAITVRYPFCRGQHRVSHLPLLRRLTSRDEIVAARLTDGSRLTVHLGDMVGRTIYFFCGDHDPRLSWLCRHVLRPGDCCIDLGANVGAVALRAARLVGPRGSIHAVEPQADLAQGLRDAAARNGYTQLHVHSIALADFDGPGRLYRPSSGDRGVATLRPSTGEPWLPAEVAVRHAGRFLQELDIRGTALLKIDVEGAEESVLTAAASVLQERSPMVIAFESFFDRATAFEERGVIRLIRSLGYELFEWSWSAFRIRLVRICPGSPPASDGWDFVAISKSPDSEAIRSRVAVGPPL